VYEDEEEKLKKQGVKCSCPGGGRIKHFPANKSIFVYGYSQVRDACSAMMKYKSM
jgi:hypothetical protein